MATATQHLEPEDRPEESLCPYCGAKQAGGERCDSCGGLFEPLSRQATQNEMGPWYIRDEDAPFAPGRSYQALKRLVAKRRLKPDTVIRGPSTRQFWARARHVQGVAHLLGECHNCHAPARATDYMCRACGAVFTAPSDRQHLGLAPMRLIPGQASPEQVARLSMSAAASPLPRAAPERRTPAERVPAPAGKPSPASPKPEVGVEAPASGESRATKRLRRDVGRLRALAIAAILVNVALLGAVIIMAAQRNAANSGAAAATSGGADGAAADSATAAPGESAPVAADAGAGETPSALTRSEARSLVERAESLATEDSQESLEGALVLLRRVKREAPAGAKPVNLDTRITALERRLDELTLRDFLPPAPPER